MAPPDARVSSQIHPPQHWDSADRVGELVTPPSSASPELAQVWWAKHRGTVLSPRPASRSKVGGHQREGDRSSCWCRPFFSPPVLEVMTGPERSSLDVIYLTWHPDVGRGWGGHKNFSWHLQTSSTVTQHQQSRFHWTVSGSSYSMGRSAAVRSPSLHLQLGNCQVPPPPSSAASYWADMGHCV